MNILRYPVGVIKNIIALHKRTQDARNKRPHPCCRERKNLKINRLAPGVREEVCKICGVKHRWIVARKAKKGAFSAGEFKMKGVTL